MHSQLASDLARKNLRPGGKSAALQRTDMRTVTETPEIEKLAGLGRLLQRSLELKKEATRLIAEARRLDAEVERQRSGGLFCGPLKIGAGSLCRS